jgi:hypothetical protein
MALATLEDEEGISQMMHMWADAAWQTGRRWEMGMSEKRSSAN